VIVYTTTAEDISAGQLRGGFWAGWPNPPSPETHLRLLRGSDFVVLALDGATGNVVGFISAISDGVLAGYVPLLEVLPHWQGRGIGGELVQRMLDQLRHLYMVDLLCDAELQPFYERFGLHRATGMFLRNYDRQTGVPE
jgi:GNAT superfamily N-acetyltransferase